MKNIEIFEELSPLTLAKLYASFPRSLDVDPIELALLLPDDLWSESTEVIGGQANHQRFIREKSPGGLVVPMII